MCRIFSCFEWSIDIIQRVLTFMLACIMSAAICVGVTVCIMAGIAYGYNYSLSEFLTFSRSDVTVYVRRGQFHDKGELPFSFRRAGGSDADEDMFSASSGTNSSNDYDNPNVVKGNSKELSDSWKLAHDTRSYAEKLTKFGYGGQDLRKNFADTSRDDSLVEPDIMKRVTDTETMSPLFSSSLSPPLTRTESTLHSQTLRRIKEIVNRPNVGLAELVENKGLVDVEEMMDKDNENQRSSKKKHKHKHKHRKIINADADEDYENEEPEFKPIK